MSSQPPASEPPPTFEQLAPDPDKNQGPRGRRVAVWGAIFTAILTILLTIPAYLFAPRSAGIPTRLPTATDVTLGQVGTQTTCAATPALATGTALGCSISLARSEFTAQRFTNGWLFLQKNPAPGTVYVIFDDGNWAQAPAPTVTLPDCPEASKAGQAALTGILRVEYCNDAKLRTRLGAPAQAERSLTDQQIETYSNGVALSLPEIGLFALTSDGAARIVR